MEEHTVFLAERNQEVAPKEMSLTASHAIFAKRKARKFSIGEKPIEVFGTGLKNTGRPWRH